MKRDIFLSAITFFILSGCTLFSKGDYKLDALNNLKSSEESVIFKDFHRNSNFSINGHHWTALMKYNPEIRDIVVIELNESNTEDRTIEEKATLF